jgi:hypothetical protein
MNPSFQCGNAVARIRVDGNISHFLTFRLAGIRVVGGRTPSPRIISLISLYIIYAPQNASSILPQIGSLEFYDHFLDL